MCNFWSCILTRDGKVLWNKDDNSHEECIKKAGLKDDKLENRDFVRLEVTPKDIFSKKQSDWALKVDEEKTLPAWFTSRRKENEAAVWREWHKAMKATLWKLDLQAAQKVVKEAKVLKFFSMHAQPVATWKLHRAQTWDAARDAARDAAWDAAGDAARDAAWEAARDAAWEAAWEAAGDATRDAAGEAARDASLLARCKLARVKGKHLKHAEARWDVWRRGYALCCDVNGVLYAYCLNTKPRPSRSLAPDSPPITAANGSNKKEVKAR